MQFSRSTAVTLIVACWVLASLASGYGKDPYKVLGVEKGADEAAIKRAYKKLALKYHPDKNPKGQAKFIEIQQAYELLSDADKKREYDMAGGAGGDNHYHSHYQGSSRHQHHHYQHHYHQQQNYYYYQQQQQQQQEQMYERALPSNTSFLTTSNFRSLVIYGGRPWLIMVYTENSQACRDFSATWEVLWKSLGGSQPGGGSRDGASVGLGRIHARFQRNLVQLIARSGGPFSAAIVEEDLPLLIAVPTGCAETSCFVRYRGPLRLSALQDFVADRLLRLTRVPQLEPHGVAAFLRRASQYKVVMVAFGRGGGSGSLALRSLASRQKDMLTVARAHVQEGGSASAAAWQAALGLSSPPAAGHVVFLRGPGTVPHTLVVPAGKASELQQQIDERGLLWQEIPPLRPTTGASLGCLWGRVAAASGRSMIDTCVLAVAPQGAQLDEARRRFALLGRYLAVPSAKRDPTMAAAATAYMDGKLRLVWMDASAQQPVCRWLMGLPDAMRPTNSAPPPGTNAAGRAAAAKQAMAAAAARSPELARAVCGPATLDVLGRARGVAAAVAGAAGLHTVAAALRPRQAAHVVVIRPSLDGSSWFRGSSSHMQHGRPVFMYAVNADFELSSPERGLDVELPKLATWINQLQSDPERHMHASPVFPPALRPDEEQSALEFVLGRVYEVAVFVLRFVMNAGAMTTDGSSPLSAELQFANLVVALAALVLVQMAFWRRPDDRAARGRAAAGAHQRWRGAPTSSGEPSATATPAGAVSPGGAMGSDVYGSNDGQRRHSDTGRDDSGDEHQDNGADDSGRRVGRGMEGARTGVRINRRAASPSWQSGRRGDAQGNGAGDAEESSDGPAISGRSSGSADGTEKHGLAGSSHSRSEENPSSGDAMNAGPAAGVVEGHGSGVNSPPGDDRRNGNAEAEEPIDSTKLGSSQNDESTCGRAPETVEGGTADTAEAAARPGSSGGAGRDRERANSNSARAVPEDGEAGDEAAEVGEGWTVVGSPRGKASVVSGRHGS